MGVDVDLDVDVDVDVDVDLSSGWGILRLAMGGGGGVVSRGARICLFIYISNFQTLSDLARGRQIK